jgi:hypothetical protein
MLGFLWIIFSNFCFEPKLHIINHIFINVFFVIPFQFVVGLGDKVSPTDIEEGMRVG